MTEDELFEQKREARAEKKKKYMRRRIVFFCALFVVASLVIFGIVRLVGAVSSMLAKPESITQIGPTLPLSTDVVAPYLTPYDYSAPVPTSAASDDADFSNALLLGDSRVAVYSVYSGILPSGMAFAYNENISVTSALTAKFTLSDGSEATLSELISKKSYDRIYLEFGLNELGWQYSSAFAEGYTALLSEIKSLAPTADIYAQSIIPVSASLGSEYVTNERIAQYDALILSSSENLNAYYVNLSEAFSSGTGLDESYDAGNGIGLAKAGGTAWINYLKSHVVNKENYS